MVDVIGGKAGAHELLEQVGFLVRALGRAEAGERVASVAALLEGIGSAAVSAPFRAAEDADVIVVIGANPTENHPVAATYFRQAARRGAKLIVMDPRGTALMRYATHRLSFTPGRDVAMLKAILHTIINEDLYNRSYVEAHTTDFDKLAEGVKDYAPEVMAEVCGISAPVLRDVARLY
ncbi:MAG: molybdopterin-dependent oxidoreductase, partial [Microvirga sp.]